MEHFAVVNFKQRNGQLSDDHESCTLLERLSEERQLVERAIRAEFENHVFFILLVKFVFYHFQAFVFDNSINFL
jgi:hypothetical protein